MKYNTELNNHLPTEKSLTEDLISYCNDHASFTQSPMWTQVKNTWEHEYIVSKDENGNIRGIMLMLIKKLPLIHSAFLYSPRGPVCDMKDIATLKDLIGKAKLTAARHNAFMLKIDPMIDDNDEISKANLIKLGFVHHSNKVGYDNIQSRENYILDIKDKTADEVFDSFKSKWRYNIRLAKKRGVHCQFYGEEKLDDFMALMKETAKRDGFCMRDRDYYARILKAFDGKAKLCMCYLDDEPLSGALCIEYGGVMSYVYGCSSAKHRNCMPNYLMQWSMIEKAISDGCHTYDFCGIPYWYDKEHKNYGVYHFKSGFGGEVITYAGEFDYRFKRGMAFLFDVVRRVRG